MKKYWERLRPYCVLLFPLFVVGMVLGAYPGYKAYEFVWKNERFCTSCHVHDYASISWSESGHGKLTTCHDCHHQPLHVYAMEPMILLLKNPQFPRDLKHTPYVQPDLCESCHVTDPHDTSNVTGPMEKQDIRKIPKIDKMVLHRAHLEKKTKFPSLNTIHTPQTREEVEHAYLGPEGRKPLEKDRSIVCADCHGGPLNRAHNFKVVDLACIRCHEKQHAMPVGKTFGCKHCHYQEFAVPIGAVERTSSEQPPGMK